MYDSIGSGSSNLIMVSSWSRYSRYARRNGLDVDVDVNGGQKGGAVRISRYRAHHQHVGHAKRREHAPPAEDEQADGPVQRALVAITDERHLLVHRLAGSCGRGTIVG
jgi:hypothetical protein